MNRRQFLLSASAFAVATPVFANVSNAYVGAFYATNSKLLQRVYVPDFADSEIDQQHMHPGESILRVPRNLYVQGGAPFVQALLGNPSHNGYCGLLDENNVVVNCVIADPEIHPTIQGYKVVQDNSLRIGDIWAGV